MATVSFEAFLPEVVPEVQGAPEPLVLNAIRNACFDFCRESLVWNDSFPAVAYTIGEAEYTLTPVDTNARVVFVFSLNIDDKKVINPTTPDELARERPAWRTTQGTIDTYTQPALNKVRLVAVPDTSGTFTPHVAYAPKRTATAVDEALFDIYLEAIKYGALWKLKSATNAPWSDPQGAAVYEQRFRAQISDAIVERNRGNARVELRVAPRSFI